MTAMAVFPSGNDVQAAVRARRTRELNDGAEIMDRVRVHVENSWFAMTVEAQDELRVLFDGIEQARKSRKPSFFERLTTFAQIGRGLLFSDDYEGARFRHAASFAMLHLAIRQKISQEKALTDELAFDSALVDRIGYEEAALGRAVPVTREELRERRERRRSSLST